MLGSMFGGGGGGGGGGFGADSGGGTFAADGGGGGDFDAQIASQGQTTPPKKASQHADVSEPCSVTGFRRFPPRAARGGHRIAHSAAHHAEGGEVGAIESGEDLIVQEMSRKGSQALPQGRRAIPLLEHEHAARSPVRAFEDTAHRISRFGASIRASRHAWGARAARSARSEISRRAFREKRFFFIPPRMSAGRLLFKIQKSHDRAASSRISSPHGTRAHPRRSRRESAPRRDG